MLIDFHAHVGDFRQRGDAEREPLTWDELIARLDDERNVNMFQQSGQRGIPVLFHGPGFVDGFQNRLLFGTDVCYGGAEGRMPHQATLNEWLAEGKLTQSVFDKIRGENALRVLGADDSIGAGIVGV